MVTRRFSLRLPADATHELRRHLRHDQDVHGLGIDPALLRNDASLVCVMFLESEVTTATATATADGDDRVAGKGRRIANETPSLKDVLIGASESLIRAFQPAPHMLHSELLVVSATGECRHFATYVGDEAQWRDRGAEYYRLHRWRGVPVDGGDGVERIAAECDAEVGAAYSIARYALSTPLLGWMSRAVRKRTRDPAHCGGLTARIVQNALAERGAAILPLASTRYSPSDLYNGLCARADTMDFDGSDAMLRDEELIAAADLLLTGTDAEVRRLGGRKRAEALKTLAVRMNVALADPRGVSEAQRTHHARTFGWAATRVADSFGGGDEVVLGAAEAAPIGVAGEEEGEGADVVATVEGVVWSPGTTDGVSPLPGSP